MSGECARYPVTQQAKQIYSSWSNDVSHPEMLSHFADRCIRRTPRRIVAMAKQSSGVSYGFVGIKSEFQQQIRAFCFSQGISITKFLSCVIELSHNLRWRYIKAHR